MVVERFNPPTRDQLARIAQGDERLIRAFEQLWSAAGQEVPDIDIDTSDLLLSLGASDDKVSQLISTVKELTEAIGKTPPHVVEHPEVFIPPSHAAETGQVHGYGNYADTSTASTPLVLAAGVWTSIPNDGLGSASQERLPAGVTTLLGPGGEIDISDLPLDSEIYVRQDYEVTPSSNNAGLQFRYSFGAGLFTLEQSLPRLDRGAGIPYKFSLVLDYFFVGAAVVRDNPVLVQVNLSTPGTLVNIGMAVSLRLKI